MSARLTFPALSAASASFKSLATCGSVGFAALLLAFGRSAEAADRGSPAPSIERSKTAEPESHTEFRNRLRGLIMLPSNEFRKTDLSNLHQIVEIRPAYAQNSGRFRYIALAHGQGFLHKRSLELFDFGAQIQTTWFVFRFHKIQISGSNQLSFGHHDGALHAIFELAHIARPG